MLEYIFLLRVNVILFPKIKALRREDKILMIDLETILDPKQRELFRLEQLRIMQKQKQAHQLEQQQIIQSRQTQQADNRPISTS